MEYSTKNRGGVSFSGRLYFFVFWLALSELNATKEVNRVDEKHEQRAGEITVAVKLAGLDEQITKANELVETIRKARSLADDLAKGINSIELEL